MGDDADPDVTLEREADRPDHVSEVIHRLAGRGDAYGRYRLKGEIARGGQGAILRVWDEDLRRNLAMKVILGKDAHVTGETPSVDSRTLGRFLEEAQVTGQLDHPGIVPVHELGLDDEGRAYFTMKLVKGQSLKSIFGLVHAGDEDWSVPHALRVMLRVCEAMAYAHAKGVIHRDLKPSNVMVGKYGEVYVMDWGLARVLDGKDEKDIRIRPPDATIEVVSEMRERSDDSPEAPLITMDGDVVGTPAYMSPEQALGDLETMGPPSDVYAAGAMLYHLLAGRMPYVKPGTRPSNYAIWSRVQEGPPAPLRSLAPDAPAELVAICEKAMARHPRERYPDMTGMARDIEAYLEQRPVAAHQPGIGHVLKLAVRRNKPVALSVGAALAVVVLLVAAFVLRLSAANRTSQRRADVLEASALVAEEEDLYPALPSEIPRMRHWLDRVQDLLSREARYRNELDPGVSEGDRALLGPMLDDLGRLRDLRGRVAERMAVAAEVERKTVVDEAQAWERARDDVASLPIYAGLQLEPQLGLIPLWRSEYSGLWEFWEPASGDRPEVIDPSEGTLDVEPETGIVLVLLPPGDGIAPFFLGKYEVTQAQFERVMGFNPSKYDAERAPRSGLEVTPVHPVESVSWYDADGFARRLALVLPTEAQWEHGCRAGTTGLLCWGDDWTSLEGVENVRDQSLGPEYAGRAPWDDGFPVHAPVGTFVANGFGLFDVHGNVSEWCGNVHPLSPIQGIDPGKADEAERRLLRMGFRGGSWYMELRYQSSAFTQNDAAIAANQARGFRVARSLDPGE